MQYIQFKQQLEKFIVFNLTDIRKIEANFDLRRLSEWQKKGYIKIIRNGYYILSDLIITEEILFLIANKIYSPSYISLEAAFSYYNLIPEGVYEITSVTTKKTNNFITNFAEFSYSHIRANLMFGYNLVKYAEHNYCIATIEKSILDYLYLNPHLQTKKDFIELRFKSEEFKRQADKIKLMNFLDVYDNQSLHKRVNNFLEFINYA